MSYQLDRWSVGAPDEDVDIHIVPHEHGNAYPWWSDDTRAVLAELREEDVRGKHVLDFGAGASGILGIAAARLGAKSVVFVERDPELQLILAQQLAANRVKVETTARDNYDFALANLGNAHEVGQVAKLAKHGIGTDEHGAVIRW